MDLGNVGENNVLHKNLRLIPTNLQHFGGEKTEKPTSKKKREARNKGQVVQSKDLASAISLLTVFFGLDLMKEYLIQRLLGLTRIVSSAMEEADQLAEASFSLKLLGYTFENILLIIMPVLSLALVTGVMVSYFQVGNLFTTKTLMPKLDKINPINGFKRLFSVRSLVELAKSVSKAGVLMYITGSYVLSRQMDIMKVFDMNVYQIAALMWDILFNVMIRSVIVLLVIGVLDFAYKRWQNEKDLMMSKQEIKDEYKMTEGDPKIKGKIRQKQREISMGRMMQEVPKADVIITNPTHFAVAIQYDPDKADAPKVVAKGKNLIAQNIKKVAEENEIPIVENKPLARALYAEVEIGDFIPEELYHAVAEVLAYVYKLKKSV